MEQIVTDEMYDWMDNIDNNCKHIDGIHELYKYLLALVNDVDSPFFIPDMFAYLTTDQFVDWILSNNY